MRFYAKFLAGLMVLAITAAPSIHAHAKDNAPQAMPATMSQAISQMTPERQARIMALSPQTRSSIFALFSRHKRQSKNATLLQVMREIEADLQTVQTGILTDNGEMAAAAALRIADHRLPRGGMLAYLPDRTINDESLSVLVGMNETVEGGAQRLAELAGNNDMADASMQLSKIIGGCVSCHAIFRGQPGQSANLKSQQP